MAKRCLKCGHLVNDQARFCSQCGSAEFAGSQTNAGNQNSQQVYGEQGFQPPQPPVQQKKGLKWWQILLIVLGSLFGLIAVGCVILVVVVMLSPVDEGVANVDSSASYKEEVVTPIATPEVKEDSKKEQLAYTKGEIIDGWYINEWADIKFQLTDKWQEGSEATYQSYESEVEECGLVCEKKESGLQFSLVFEKITEDSISKNDTYLFFLETSLMSTYGEYDIACDKSEHFNVTMAGKNYRATKLTIEDGAMYQYLGAHNMGDYRLVFSVTSSDEEEIKEVLASVQTISDERAENSAKLSVNSSDKEEVVMPTGTPELREDSKEEQIAYTKGEIVDGWYINEWADIKLQITDEWPEGSKEAYQAYESGMFECGLTCEKPTEGRLFSIAFEKLHSDNDWTDDIYLGMLEARKKPMYEKYGVACEVTEHFVIEMAGKTYNATKLIIADGGIYQYVAVGRIGDYWVHITVSSFEEEDIIELLASVQTVN